jgi:3-hydroxyisobutyrate dehydrogenase
VVSKAELLTRTKAFSLRILKLVDDLPRTMSSRAIGNQLVRSGTAIGANYRAACRARSRAEFTAKLGIVAEEADETVYWLELIRDGKLLPGNKLAELLQEADELTAIFTAGRRTSSKNQTSNLKHQTSNMNIGFVGVGRMGANMARHLKDCGFHVTAVYDVNRKTATDLAAELGCAAAQDLSEVTAESDVIFTVVTDDNATRKIFSGTGDNLLVNARGKLFVNCATISPQVHVEIEKLAEEAGAQALEACMASSITQAREGKLYLMCGGREESFRRAEPILKELGSIVRFIGRAGEAAKVKALVNMELNINTAGLAEGLGLGAALGLDLTTLREVFSQTGANSRVLETDGEDMQNREHTCFFSAAHAAKDSGIALELARNLGLGLPLARATKEQYDRMVAEDLGELDKSGIAELTFKDRRKHSGDRV